MDEEQTKEERRSRHVKEVDRNSKKSSHRPPSSNLSTSNHSSYSQGSLQLSTTTCPNRSGGDDELISSEDRDKATTKESITRDYSKEDRDAKRRAARRFKDGDAISGGVAVGKVAPKGVVVVEDHSPSRNKKKNAINHNYKEGSRHHRESDDKKKYRSRRVGDRIISPSAPGAVAFNGREDSRRDVSSSYKSSAGRDRDAKGRGGRHIKGPNNIILASSAESVEDSRRSRKESRETYKNNNKKKKAPVALQQDEEAAAAATDEGNKPLDAAMSEDGEFEGVLAEMVVQDDEAHQREQEIRSMEQEQANNDNGGTDSRQSKQQHIRTPSLFFCMGCCFILAIGGVLYGVGILSFSSAEETKVGSDVSESPTKAPSVVKIPSDASNLSPTSAPTFFVYDPISADQCTAIASGDTVNEQEDMIEKNFALILDSQLAFTVESPILLQTIHQKIQEVLAPKMAGCDDNDDVINRHYRRSLNAKDHDELKYIVGNLVVTRVVETGEECSPASAGVIYCIGMRVEIGIFARGNDLSTYDYIGKLSSILNGESFDLAIELELNEIFRKVLLVRLITLDPTPAPTIPAPTTDWPSMAPTVMASSNPSFMPVLFPVTSEPTSAPTNVPSKAPVTPSPTRPSVTANPTRMATPNPTKTPTRSPSGSPSETPSLGPSGAPSVVPSSQPTYGPTTNPSRNPSKVPSSFPSLTPTNSPSKTPGLYCGCTTASLGNRGADNLSQQDCVRYCRDEGHSFAGAVNGVECWCGEFILGGGESHDCNTTCPLQGPGNCYDDLASCTCGGSGSVTTLFRTSPSPSCPKAGLLRSDYATGSWTPVDHNNWPPIRGIDGDTDTFTLGDFGTPEQHPTYQVDLGFVAAITKIRVRNRPGCSLRCRSTMNGFTLELLDGSEDVISGTARLFNELIQPAHVPTFFDFVFSGITGVRYIRLEAPDSEGSFQFSEIYAEGVAQEQ